MIPTKSFEIFSGTGGVGKTTIATSRAIQLAQDNLRVLLITIDPSKRLKELLNIRDEQAGEPIRVSDPLGSGEDLNLDVELMSPAVTFNKMAIKNNCSEVMDNRILKILTKPFGGLNEILSIVELNDQYKSQKYDVVILDTPPGSHFLDFLDSASRIKVFFDQSFIEIFQYLGKKVDIAPINFGKKIFTMVVSKGVKKLLGYLERVTGSTFVDEFIDSVIAIYKTRDSFIDALNLQETLKDPERSNWFLVTSVEQSKLDEAIELRDSVATLVSNNSYVILNKSLEEKLTEWEPKTDEAKELKSSLVQKESSIHAGLKSKFKDILKFTEILSSNPDNHIKELTRQWQLHKT